MYKKSQCLHCINIAYSAIRVYALKVEPRGLYNAVEGLLIDYLTSDYPHEKKQLSVGMQASILYFIMERS